MGNTKYFVVDKFASDMIARFVLLSPCAEDIHRHALQIVSYVMVRLIFLFALLGSYSIMQSSFCGQWACTAATVDKHDQAPVSQKCLAVKHFVNFANVHHFVERHCCLKVASHSFCSSFVFFHPHAGRATQEMHAPSGAPPPKVASPRHRSARSRGPSTAQTSTTVAGKLTLCSISTTCLSLVPGYVSPRLPVCTVRRHPSPCGAGSIVVSIQRRNKFFRHLAPRM